jgi:hypothetical protein
MHYLIMLLFSFLFLLVQNFSSFTHAEKDSINWRTRRELNWTDFKATPVESAPNAALTSTSILLSYAYDKKSVTFQLKCVFHPEKSWVRVNSPHILAHEQGHFDISQLFTRKLFKSLSEYDFKPGSVDKDVKTIYQQVATEQSAYQELYDQETNYSRNKEVQLSWQEKIETELRAAEKYATYPE